MPSGLTSGPVPVPLRGPADGVVRCLEHTRAYQVFICYNTADVAAVRRVQQELEQRGIACWVDSDIGAGRQPVDVLESILETVPVATVLVGGYGLGPWQRLEYHYLLRRKIAPAAHPLELIPALIDGARGVFDLPPFAQTFSAVDLRDPAGGGIDELAAVVQRCAGATKG